MLGAVLGTAAVLLVALVTIGIKAGRTTGRIEDGVAGLYRYIDSKFEDHDQRITRLESWQDRSNQVSHPAGRNVR